MQVFLASTFPKHEQGKEPGRTGHHPRAGGAVSQIMLQDEAADGLNIRFQRTQFFGGDKTFHSPRHNHAFPQVRFTESGVVNYAPGQNIEAGNICYFPRAAYYGPQTKDQGVSVAVQYGFNGECQDGPSWRRYREEALRRLNERGSFRDGLFISANGHAVDAVLALHKEQYWLHTNREFDYRPAVYETPILFHPKAFEYYQAAPGIEVKQFGRFYDHPGPNGDTGILMARLSGAAYRLTADRAQIAWTRGAGLTIDGETYGEPPFLYSPRGEETVIAGPDGIEIYVIEFPRLD